MATTPFRELLRVADELHIEVRATAEALPLSSGGWTVDGEYATDAQSDAYIGMLTSELALYTADTIGNMKLRQVVLCADLTLAGEKRNAVPLCEDGVLVLDVNMGTEGAVYQRRLLHHELYHFIDYQDDGRTKEDPQWESLNAKGFAYSGSTESAQADPRASVRNDDLPGFLTLYGTTTPEEDKAEYFSLMMVDYKHVTWRARTDAVVAAKLRLMRDRLVRFNAAFGNDYWHGLTSIQRER